MNRPMLLAYEGWYPENHTDCVNEIKKYVSKDINLSKGRNIKAVIVPHAGWRFSGNLSINCINLLSQALTENIKTVIIFGGHLPGYNQPILETFEKAHTPLGYIDSDKDAVKFISEDLSVTKKDFLQDNSIEILLPIIKYFLGNIKIVCIYMPPSDKYCHLLDKIFNYFKESALYIGSADLTHYGSNYHFIKNTEDLQPVEWVKYVNDHNYIKLLLEMKYKASIDYAIKNSSSCSAGAAAAAVYMSEKFKIERGELYGYSTSYEVLKSESFVGYAGILY